MFRNIHECKKLDKGRNMKAESPKVSMICVISKNFGIGFKNKLLFDISSDLKYFHRITDGHPVIMGRKTYNSIGHPLSNRLNIILSRDDSLEIPDCKICHTIDDALKIACENDQDEIFIIGGGMVYREGIKHANRLYLTIVDEETQADTFFPDYSDFTKVVSSVDSVDNGYKIKYLILERS